MTALGTLSGSTNEAMGINDAGQVVGYTTAHGGYQAYLYSGGTMTNLVGLGEPDSYANGINNAGQVVGQAFTLNVGGPAYLFSGGVMTSLGTLGGTDSDANAINSSGQVVGYSFTTGNAAINAFYIRAAS